MDNPSKSELTSSFGLFKKSKDLVMKNLKLFLILYSIPFVFTLLNIINPPSKDTSGNGLSNDISGNALPNINFGNISTEKIGLLIGGITLVAVVVAVLASLYQTMVYRLELDASVNKVTTLGKLWGAAKKYWLKLIGLNVLIVLIIVTLGIAIGLFFSLMSSVTGNSPTVLLIGIVAMLFLIVILIRRYFLSPYFLIDKNLGVVEALRQSADSSKPYTWKILSILLVFILLSIPSFLPYIGPVIGFTLTMLYSVAPALRYQEIKDGISAENTSPTTTSPVE